MFLEKWLVIGCWNKRCGKFICQPLATFLGPSSTFARQTKLTKQTYLFLPDDTLGRGRARKTYKFALAVVDSASHHIKAEPSTSKEATEIAGTFRRILHSWTAEVARIFASRPEGRVHGRCHQTYESKWDNHSSRTRGYSQRSGNRWKIQSHPCWAPIRVPICCWNAAAQGSKIFRMGSRLPAVVSALNNEVTDWLIAKKFAEAIKEKAVAGKLAKFAKQTCQCRFLRFIALKQVGSARFCLPKPHKS